MNRFADLHTIRRAAGPFAAGAVCASATLLALGLGPEAGAVDAKRPPPPPPPAAPAALPGLPPDAPAATATVVGLDRAAKRRHPAGTAHVQILAHGHHAWLGRLDLAPGAKVPEHQDETEEYLFVLAGSGTLTLDGTRHAIRPGTAIYMPAGAKVSYDNGDEKLLAVQVFAGPAPAAKYRAWKEWTP